jgi:hypothetical protein
LPVDLYWCETWYLRIREEHKLRAFGKKCWGEYLDQRGMDWREGGKKLQNEELHNLYSSPSKIRIIKSRRMRWAGHVARMGEKRNVYRLLVRKPEGKNH